MSFIYSTVDSRTRKGVIYDDPINNKDISGKAVPFPVDTSDPLDVTLTTAETTPGSGSIIIGTKIIISFCLWGLQNAIGYFASKSDKVKDVLSTKKGSIKQAPLPPGSPSWDDIKDMTMEEIEERARKNEPGYKTIKKLLTDKRFNK